MADWLQNCQEWDWQEWVWLQCVRFVKLSMMHDDDDWPNYGLWYEQEMVTGYTQDEAGLWFPFFLSKSAFIFTTTFCPLQNGQRNSIDPKIAKKPLFLCPPSIFDFQIPMTISGSEVSWIEPVSFLFDMVTLFIWILNFKWIFQSHQLRSLSKAIITILYSIFLFYHVNSQCVSVC